MAGPIWPPVPRGRLPLARGVRMESGNHRKHVRIKSSTSSVRTPKGLNGKQIAQEVGVSNATATKAINALLESGQIRAEGARRARKLFPA